MSDYVLGTLSSVLLCAFFYLALVVEHRAEVERPSERFSGRPEACSVYDMEMVENWTHICVEEGYYHRSCYNDAIRLFCTGR